MADQREERRNDHPHELHPNPVEHRKQLWTQSGGGDLEALREQQMGSNGETEGHDTETEDETPETTRQLSDASWADPRHPTKASQSADQGGGDAAIERNTSVLGSDEEVGGENGGRNQGLGTEGRFSEKGR